MAQFAILDKDPIRRRAVGDCLVYGVAKAEREPPRFRGAEFSQTDLEPALKD
jgi:uncharacterized protein with PIN domain